MKKKIILSAIVALSLALLVAVGGSIAWLIATDNPIVNTFTPTNIDITLTETENLDFSMVPGNLIYKDPKVTVDNDIPCYVFVKITESSNYDNYISYIIESGWTLYKQPGTEGSNIPTGETAKDYVIYREVGVADANTPFSVLAGNSVTVLNTVDKDMMNRLENGTEANPTITFKAVAVQSDNLSLEQAYAQAFPSTTTD